MPAAAVPVPPLSWAPNWQPFTIIGDSKWSDYTVAADVYLGPGERAAVLGRINDVGTGYGYIPQSYMLELTTEGKLRLSISRGKEDKAELVGDWEQRALIAASTDRQPGGVAILATAGRRRDPCGKDPGPRRIGPMAPARTQFRRQHDYRHDRRETGPQRAGCDLWRRDGRTAGRCRSGSVEPPLL